MSIPSGVSAIISRSNKGKRITFVRSLRFRIMAILILVGILSAVTAVTVVVQSYSTRAVNLRISHVQNQCEILTDALEAEDYVHQTDNDVINSELRMLSNLYNGRILVVDSAFKVISDTYDLDVGRTSVSEEVLTCMAGGGAQTLYDADEIYIELIMPLDNPETHRIDGVLVASISTNEIDQNAHILELRGARAVLLVSLLVLIGGFFLAKLLVKPFHRVTKAIEDITDGYAEDTISVEDYSETQQITEAFNTMLSRVKNMDNSRNDFVSNVSHELKTPMTSMKILAESLVAMEDVPVEMYREFMNDIVHEIDRENRIIGDLLDMVRMDRKSGGLNMEKVDIGGLLEQTVRIIRPIADRRGVSLLLETAEKVEAEIDEMKMSTCFQNLIENAVKYNVEGGWVRIDLRRDGRFFIVSVSDSGIGIAEDQQDHIFERFYRVDKSHSTEIEGTGLGLWITRRAVLLHHGTISVYSKPGEGTTFSIRLPILGTGEKGGPS